MQARRKRPTTSIVVAAVAAVALIAGSATAASLITSAKIKDGTIKSRDLNKSLRKQIAKAKPGAKGDRGDKGDKGDNGTPGATGPSDAFVALKTSGTALALGTAGTIPEDTPAKRVITLAVPAGKYVVQLTGRVIQFPGDANNFGCILAAGDDSDYRTYGFNGSETARDLSHTVTHEFASASEIVVRCHSNAATGSSTAQSLRLVALRVGSLTETGS